MSPELTFGTFESWGGRERVRNNDECVYYFFVDDWGDTPKLCLMERAVKHARVVAEIKAPAEMVKACVAEQGSVALFEQSFAINGQIREWLINNVLDDGNPALVVPIYENEEVEDMGPRLPDKKNSTLSGEPVTLPTEPRYIQEDELGHLLKSWGFYDSEENREGRFVNCLVESGHEQTVIDLKTQLMWQRGGLDINSIRHIRKEIETINAHGFAGYNDWRLPTLEEALSLMEHQANEKTMHLHPCFSKNQPFVFVEARRKPGGYWFVDYKQGRAFWSSGTIPGGFGRLVRSLG
jgi:hypothetical protein